MDPDAGRPERSPQSSTRSIDGSSSIAATYILFPDEGHGFARPENNIAFFAIAESFLASHLGRAEPIGDAFRGSSVHRSRRRGAGARAEGVMAAKPTTTH